MRRLTATTTTSGGAENAVIRAQVHCARFLHSGVPRQDESLEFCEDFVNVQKNKRGSGWG